MQRVAVALLLVGAVAVSVSGAVPAGMKRVKVFPSGERVDRDGSSRPAVAVIDAADTDAVALYERYGQPMVSANYLPMNVTGNGWCEFYVNATSDGTTPHGDEDAYYTAGYAEGVLSVAEIDAYFADVIADWYIGAGVPAKVTAYVEQNYVWSVTESQAAANAQDPFWAEVRRLLAQVQGLYDGYQYAFRPPQRNLTLTELLYLNLDGDMPEIIGAYVPEMRRANRGPANPLPPQYNSHCSSLVRVAPDLSTVYHAHDTWSSYDSMLRIYKHYKFTVSGTDGGASGTRQVSFSSSPAFLSSVDDWYLTSNRLIVSETTNDIYNQTLNDIIASTNGNGVLMTWLRTMAANALATTGPQWAQLFSRYLSGTYPNQWIITDLKLFTPGGPLPTAGLTTICEEMPGYSETADVTPYIAAHGFWPSFNVAYLPNIRNWMGYTQMQKIAGDDYSWTKCARAQIFARDTPKTKTLADVQALMQSNNFQTDPLSKGSAYNAIASRGDLDPNSPDAFGAIDGKIATYQSALPQPDGLFTAFAIQGPTHETQKPFVWGNNWPDTPHAGQSNAFDFQWTPQCPAWDKTECAQQ